MKVRVAGDAGGAGWRTDNSGGPDPFICGGPDSDSWGCAMLGQSFALGEGTARDEAAARRFYKRSCEIAERSGEPNFEACQFARNNLETMKAR